MATKTKTLALVCPCCNDADSALKLNLSDLAEITCDGCSETFSAEQAVAMLTAQLEKWQSIAAWIANAPTGK